MNIAQTSIFSGTSIPAVYGILHSYAATSNTGGFTAVGNDIQGAALGVFYALYSTVVASATGAAVNITDNNIHGITTSSAITASTPYGIFLGATPVTANILRNKIYNLESDGTAGVADGIYVQGTTANANINIANNLIGDLRTPSSSATTPSISGIYLGAVTGAASNIHLYYNSIYLNATSSGTNFSTTGVYHTYNTTATVGALDLRDNMIINLSTPKGTGYATALRRSAATNLNNYATTSNNNNFVVGTATNSAIYYNGTTAYAALAAFQAQVTTRETNSQSINPAFLSTNSADADFLKLNVVATENQLLDNKGAAITGYTDDYAGTTRDAATPDIGAYEWTFFVPTTPPNCVTVTIPSNGDTGVQPNPTTINWTSAFGATGYTVYIGTTSNGTEITGATGVNVTGLSYQINLPPNQTYYVKVVPYNAIGAATGCIQSIFTTGYYVYCTPPYAFNGYETIGNVALADVNNPSTSSAPYEDFTSVTGHVNRGGSYPFTIAIDNMDTTGADLLSLWIDYNHNGIFETSEQTAGTINLAAGTFTGTVAIPVTAVLGNTTMRMRLSYTTTPDPCALLAYGQAEDYTINIGPQLIACTTITAPVNGATDVAYAPTAITWNAVTGATGYKVLVATTAGSTIPGVADVVDVQINNGTTTSYSVSLQPNTTYYAKVLPFDANGDAVGCTEISFKTAGPPYCTPTGGTSAQYYLNNITTTGGLSNMNYTASSYNAYDDVYNTQSFSQVAGGSVNVSLGVAPASTHYYFAWVDWNNDGDFADPGETIFDTSSGSYTSPPYNGVINIPAGQADGSYRVRFASSWLFAVPACGPAPYGNYVDAKLNVVTLTPCAGTPDAGTATASLTNVCPNTPFTLNANLTPMGGYSYQWFSSTDNVTFTTPVSGVQTTIPYTVASQTATTYYRLVVTCTNGGQSSPSTSVLVNQKPANLCYCAADADISDELISNVTFAGINNNSTSTETYEDFTSIVGNVTGGQTYPFSADSDLAYTDDQVAVWIDANQNGSFDDAGEMVYLSDTSGITPWTGNITVPVTALGGNTGMRVRLFYSDTDSPIPCGDAVYGQVEDYTLNITAAPLCTGTPSTGTASASASGACENKPFTLTSDVAPTNGYSYQWQYSTTSATTGFLPLSPVQDAVTYTVASQTVPTWYRLTVTCTGSGTSTDSNVVFVDQNTPLQCSCGQSFSGVFDFAGGIDNTSGYIVTNDFAVSPSSSYQVTSARFLLVSTGSGFTGYTVSILGDNGGTPDPSNVLYTNTFGVPTSTDPGPGTFAGYPTTYLNFDISGAPVLQNSDPSNPARYWVTITGSVGGGGYPFLVGQIRDDSSSSAPEYQSADGGTSYSILVNTNEPGVTYEGYWSVDGICNTLGVSDISKAAGIKYYPNPVKDILTIEAQGKIKSVKVFDASGKQLMTKEGANSAKSQIDFSRYAQGVYVVTTVLEDGTSTSTKVIKQ